MKGFWKLVQFYKSGNSAGPSSGYSENILKLLISSKNIIFLWFGVLLEKKSGHSGPFNHWLVIFLQIQ